MNSPKIARQLGQIDWDFSTSQKGGAVLPHWYPGTFTSQIPAAIIQSLTKSNEIIFDPFSGIGTSAAEAVRLGRRAWVTDLNPIGVMSSYVYCGLIALYAVAPKGFDLFVKSVCDFMHSSDKALFGGDSFLDAQLSEFQPFLDTVLSPKSEALASMVKPSDVFYKELLSPWLHRNTLLEVEVFISRIESLNTPFLKLFLYYAVSSNLRVMSSQIKSWGHIADNVKPKEFVYKNVSTYLYKWMIRLSNSFKRIDIKPKKDWFCDTILRVDVHDWDSSDTPGYLFKDAVSALITSPPYGDAIDYINSQKLSLYALGYNDDDVKALVKKEIGARRKRFNKNSREVWAEKLSETIEKQVKYLGEGYVAAILPHKNHGREIGLNLMSEKLKSLGWGLVFEVDRSISQKKTRQSWTSIKQETICVFSNK